jgi:hypothetical protein
MQHSEQRPSVRYALVGDAARRQWGRSASVELRHRRHTGGWRPRTVSGLLWRAPPFIAFARGVTNVKEMPNALDPLVGTSGPRFHPPH